MRKYFFLLIALFLLINCSKKSTEVPGNQNNNGLGVLISQEVLDYANYKVGSYWIYQDSLSGAIDTVKVINNSVESAAEPGYGAPTGEQITITLTSSFYDSITYLQLEFYNSCADMYREYPYSYYSIGTLCGPPFPDSFFVTSPVYGNSRDTDTSLCYSKFYVLHQNGQVIDSVVKTYNSYLFTYDSNGHIPRGYLYFKKHLLYVRKEILYNGFAPNRIWILKQYNIVQ